MFTSPKPPEMEEQVTRLVSKVWETFLSLPPSSRYLISVSGVPGSGKTTLAQTMVSRLNALASSASSSTTSSIPPISLPLAMHIPMDGYHYTRAQLSAMPDPSTAHARRGAAFTFDADAYLALVKLLREPLSVVPAVGISSSASNSESQPKGESKPSPTPTIFAPSFSHALKDPVADDIPIPPSSRLLFFEGNYVNLAYPADTSWDKARKLMDEVWWVDVSKEVAVERLAVRHVEAGIVESTEEGRERASGSDAENAREIEKGRGPASEWVVGEGGRMGPLDGVV